MAIFSESTVLFNDKEEDALLIAMPPPPPDASFSEMREDTTKTELDDGT
jgi:hypothetical protein